MYAFVHHDNHGHFLDVRTDCRRWQIPLDDTESDCISAVLTGVYPPPPADLTGLRQLLFDVTGRDPLR
ncbi:hypothetical protein [Longispora albida]|uniref:hypothetical protein n=1 Tax=Longispora albida TaxID=203523 RepID=UPI0003794F89|nr:hypothetical protein [Longispora albida]